MRTFRSEHVIPRVIPDAPHTFGECDRARRAELRSKDEIVWGDRLDEETKGLDILGIRALDQSMETALAKPPHVSFPSMHRSVEQRRISGPARPGFVARP